MSIEVTPSMRSIVEYFEALGPRWGLSPKTSAVHALLFLIGRPLTAEDVAVALHMELSEARTAFDDLTEWRVVVASADGRLGVSGEPWDLLFAGMEERRRREIGPALTAMGTAVKLAGSDGTPRQTMLRINGLHALLKDLTALGDQMERLSPSTMKRLVSLGGQVSKILGRGNT